MTGSKKSLMSSDFAARKGGDAIVCLTAYSTPIARLADRHCDLILVGDSLGMVGHGLESTVGVTLEMMILHGQVVRRGVERALLVVDMPFGSYKAKQGGVVSQCGYPHESNRLRRGQTGGWRDHGRVHSLSDRTSLGLAHQDTPDGYRMA